MQSILFYDIGLKWCNCYFFLSNLCSNELKWITNFQSISVDRDIVLLKHLLAHRWPEGN